MKKIILTLTIVIALSINCFAVNLFTDQARAKIEENMDDLLVVSNKPISFTGSNIEWVEHRVKNMLISEIVRGRRVKAMQSFSDKEVSL